MGQITTWGKPEVTEAQRLAAKERSRERARIAETERRETLRVAGKAQLDLIAIDLALEKERNAMPPDPAIAEAQELERLAQREAGKARLAELVEQHEREIRLFYQRMETMLAGVNADRTSVIEVRKLSEKLQVSSPFSTSVMGIGESLGLHADNVSFADALFSRFSELYRKNSGQILPGPFEGQKGTKNE